MCACARPVATHHTTSAWCESRSYTKPTAHGVPSRTCAPSTVHGAPPCRANAPHAPTEMLRSAASVGALVETVGATELGAGVGAPAAAAAPLALPPPPPLATASPRHTQRGYASQPEYAASLKYA